MINPESLDVSAAKLAQLRGLFPEVFTEGKIDFKRLRDVLGDEVSFNKEHYELSWAGKSAARAQIQRTTSATLIPDDGGRAADGSGNIFIEGENLDVLHVLQRSYFGKIKMIYIDPPYNTGNDSFVYPDDYSERQDAYKKRVGITDENGFLNKQDLWKKNSKENGQFHSVWLSMMYPRLYLARNLLREDGVIFISIDDNEQANLKLLCDEIFGAENFVADIIWEKRFTRNNDAKLMSSVVEHLLLFRKSEKVSNLREPRTEKNNSIYINHDNDSRGAWTSVSYISQRTKEQRPNLSYEITNPITGEKINHEVNAWKYSFDKYQEHLKENRLYWGKDGKNTYPRLKRFLSELETGVVPINFWNHKETGTTDDGTKEVNGLIGKDVFDYPKPISLLIRMMGLVFDEADKNGIILDFFAGSGTTAHAVLELNEQDGGNRQFICVQLPEPLEESSEAYKAGYRTIADICKARITKVIEKIQAGRNSNKQTDLIPAEAKQVLGFKSFKLAPSNFKQWRGDVAGEQAILEQLELFKDSEQPGSENHAMLVELLLKAGFPLTANVAVHTVAGQALYNVESGKLLFFFDAYNDSVKDFIFTLKPNGVVCLNRVFNNNDHALTNFQLGLKDAGIELQII